MPRFFVAIPLPDEARDRLIAVQPPAFPGLRILGREELHLTLHFLGEVAAHDFDTVRTALATVSVNAFTVAINGIGMFQQEGRPQVLWAGIEANAALLELHHSIGAALADAIGFRPEDRPYSPHITLARLNGPVSPDVIERYVEANQGFGIPSVPIDRFVLYSSDFGGNVPHYREEAVFPLVVPASSSQQAAKGNASLAEIRKQAEDLKRARKFAEALQLRLELEGLYEQEGVNTLQQSLNLNWIAFLGVHSGNLAEAERAARKCLEVYCPTASVHDQETLATYHMMLSCVLAELRKFEEAVAEGEQALVLFSHFHGEGDSFVQFRKMDIERMRKKDSAPYLDDC
jgi:2'-5' RNA ligase